MPINAAILESIKANDAILQTLDLSRQKLTDTDIQQLVKALTHNNTLTTLDVNFNLIGDEGAKALAGNTTLTTLNMSFNLMGGEWENKLQEVIANNNNQLILRRNQFLRILMLLANDQTNPNNPSHAQMNPNSDSHWSQLPREIKAYILSWVHFTSTESIGKSRQQIYTCAKFVFTHPKELRTALQTAIKTKQDFKVKENTQNGYFRFFPAPEDATLPLEELTEKRHKSPIL